MRMCKYCGKKIRGDGNGPHGMWCNKKCWMSSKGFDYKLKYERRNGKMSLDAFQDKGGEIADGQQDIERLYDRMDGTENNPKRIDIVEVMDKAADIHVLLPSILIFTARGMTQTEIAIRIKIPQQTIFRWLKWVKHKLACSL